MRGEKEREKIRRADMRMMSNSGTCDSGSSEMRPYACHEAHVRYNVLINITWHGSTENLHNIVSCMYIRIIHE